ncbi:MAG: hypothetical protein ACOCP9_00375 [Halofilum sp. (in: g-proteobacteria)]
MFYSGDTFSIPDDRSSATDAPLRQRPITNTLARIGRSLTRSLARPFRNDRRELRQIANDPRMLDDIGLTRADVEHLLHRERARVQHYPGPY